MSMLSRTVASGVRSVDIGSITKRPSHVRRRHIKPELFAGIGSPAKTLTDISPSRQHTKRWETCVVLLCSTAKRGRNGGATPNRQSHLPHVLA